MASKDSVDEALYSRQLYVHGIEAQHKLSSSNVCIWGLKGGIGVEVAKNLVLTGVNSVTLIDNNPVTSLDLASNFTASPEHVATKTRRSDVAASHLQELNPYVSVRTASPSTDVEAAGGLVEFVRQFRVVCVCNVPVTTQIELATAITAARETAPSTTTTTSSTASSSHGPHLVTTEAFGVFGRLYVDFGDAFSTTPSSGEPPAPGMISSITSDNPGVVTTLLDEYHNLQTGQYVTFRELQGMESLNGCDPVQVTVTGKTTFTIGDTSSLPPYRTAGVFQQVPQPTTLSFRRLEDALANPEFVARDFAKDDYTPVIHTGFQALHAFQTSEGRLPTPGDTADADRVVAMTAELLATDGTVLSDGDRRRLSALARGAQGQLAPMAALLGGIVAQEALKSATEKFTPFSGWLYHDAMEALPDPLPSAEAAAVTGSRYDGQVVVFGRDVQEAIQSHNGFLVGAGAIGCEMLKTWAGMGVAAGPSGHVTVTDMDHIEKSNLSRQLLYRTKDIGAPKSVTAVAAALAQNPDMRLTARELRVGPETESVFNEAFWEGLDCVTTALDNREARLYLDGRCVFFQKFMLDSGTQGVMGNTTPVVPGKTSNWGALTDSSTATSIPLCTVRNFPHAIEHCCHWAVDWFAGEFEQQPSAANAYLTTPGFLAGATKGSGAAGQMDTLKKLEAALVTAKPVTFTDCLKWARLSFESRYNWAIRQLVHNFPLDMVTKDNVLFWSGSKRAPHPLEFDPSDDLHRAYVVDAATLRAVVYGIDVPGSRLSGPEVGEALAGFDVPAFEPAAVKIAVTDDEDKEIRAAKEKTWDVDSKARELAAVLPPPDASSALSVQQFDKDDDRMMTVVAAASNLRARCFGITEQPTHDLRQITGNIVPAIATTTAVVTGLTCFELYKAVQAKADGGKATAGVDVFRDSQLNLALPFIMFMDPYPCGTQRLPLPESSPFPLATTGADVSKHWDWTLWDVVPVDGGMTLAACEQYFQDNFGLELCMLTYNGTLLFNSMSTSRARVKRAMTLVELIEDVTKAPPPADAAFVSMDVACVDDEDDDVDLPGLRCRLPRRGGGGSGGAGAGAGAGSGK